MLEEFYSKNYTEWQDRYNFDKSIIVGSSKKFNRKDYISIIRRGEPENFDIFMIIFSLGFLNFKKIYCLINNINMDPALITVQAEEINTVKQKIDDFLIKADKLKSFF